MKNRKLPRAHYLQHVPFEGLGSIETWLQDAGYQITCSQLYNSEDFPRIEDIDFLVIMGGPMSVNDENVYPWLVEEKKFIKNIIEAGTATLGICLGAQLIANSMGGKVFPNSEKEIGWFPIHASKSAGHGFFQFPEEIEVLHWHGETFNLPKGAVQIAESKGCKNQAFQIGDNVIGLQFHLETTSDSAQAIVDHCRNELVEGKYIQTEISILSAPQERYDSINKLMSNVLEYIHRGNG
jgi:GMP synthase-like glutamine amidotransferase